MGWVKGQSGNPTGRPSMKGELRALARQHTAFAIEGLVEIAGNKKVTPNARVAAFNSLLDRGWGKPTQPLSGDADEPAIALSIREIAVRRAEAMKAIEELFAEVAEVVVESVVLAEPVLATPRPVETLSNRWALPDSDEPRPISTPPSDRYRRARVITGFMSA